jgi:hypothetical protein
MMITESRVSVATTSEAALGGAAVSSEERQDIRMDMQVSDVDLTPERLIELMRWHGTDESNLPPPHTLQNLARDTVAALRQLQQCRDGMEQLRQALARAYWAQDLHQLHTLVLSALGPPPPPAEELSASPSAGPRRAD